MLKALTSEKIRILKIWQNRIFQDLSISEIMKLSNRKTKTWVFNTLKELVKNKILFSERKGNADLYSLDLSNPVTPQLLQYLEAEENSNFPLLDVMIEIINNVSLKNYCLIVFGSYSDNTQKKNSDLDMCFIIENKKDEKIILPFMNHIKLNHPIEIDEHYITFSDFIEMLLIGEENLGKQIFRNHRIFYNADIYYQLIKKAHDNGFKS